MEQEPDKGTQLERMLDIALRFHHQGNLGEAKDIYQEILRVDFQHSDAWHLLGVLALQVGFVAAAIELIAEAVALDPEQPAFRNNLGNAYRRFGQLDAALRCYDAALFLKADYVEAHYNKATVLQESGELDAAVDAYRIALRLKPDDIDTLNDLGSTLRRQGDLSGAIECYRSALELEEKNPALHINLGRALEAQGDAAAALGCYEKALALEPDNAAALLWWAETRPFTLDDRAQMSRIEALLSDKGRTEEQIEYVHRVLGKVNDDYGLFERAFEHYQTANSIKRERHHVVFRRDDHADFVSRLIATFDAGFFEQKKALGSQSTLPVFVVGMPYSGKSELARVLSGDRRICSAGDLSFFEDLSKQLAPGFDSSLPYPESAELIDAESAERLAELYVEQLQKRCGEVERIIDSASNYAHLGLIALLFPNATIIHCRRHPLDVGLAIYCKYFGRGQAYAYDLGDIAACYREYERLMRHWEGVLTNGMVTIDYEDVVAAEERTRRELVQCCGLQWEEAAMKPAPVLSNRFVNYWRNYEAFLGELRSGLG